MAAKELADWLLICGLIGFGGFVSATNWIALWPRSSGHQPSLVPVIGGLFVLWGFGLSDALRPYWWTAFIVDWTVLPFRFWWGPKLAIELWKFTEYNTLHRFEAVDPSRPERMILYRCGQGEAMIPSRVSRDPRHPGYPAIGAFGRWTLDGDNFEFVREADGYIWRLTPDGDAFRVQELQNTMADHSLHDLSLRKSK